MRNTMQTDNDTIAVQVRWSIRRDMPEMLDIEQLCFEHAWTEEDFLCCLRQRNCIGMVAEHKQRIVGLMIYELLKTELHVLNFAVHPSFQRRGVGTQMVDKLKAKLHQQRRDTIRVELRERNLPAQLFFRRQRFVAVDVLRNYYEDIGEDAYQMCFSYDDEGGY